MVAYSMFEHSLPDSPIKAQRYCNTYTTRSTSEVMVVYDRVISLLLLGLFLQKVNGKQGPWERIKVMEAIKSLVSASEYALLWLVEPSMPTKGPRTRWFMGHPRCQTK
jgi:hypothetical protein